MRWADWPQRLDAALEAARSHTFAYGFHDCALFAADCVNAMTGQDYASGLRGYVSQRQGLEIVSRYGSLEGLVTALLGPPVHPSCAHRGDVVLGTPPLVVGEAGDTIGICLGAFCAFPQAVGFERYPRSVARLAWRIE